MKVLIVLAILTIIHAQNSTQYTGCLLPVPGTLQCQICSSNLQLDDKGNCGLYTPIEGCSIYNSSTNGAQCSNCSAGYLLSQGICLNMIDNCAVTSNINTCDQCSAGYVLVLYSNCFSSNVANCPLGSVPRTVNGVPFCQIQTILSCSSLSADGTYCLMCSQGYSLINGVCKNILSTIQCSNNSCFCQGYYFQNNCYNIQLPNCLQSADKIYCDLCADLYYSSNGVCLKFIKNNDINCNVLTADGTKCAGCNLNYFLNSDFICVKNFQLCPNGCSACPYANFQLYNSNCYYSDPHCLVYNFTSQVCTLCQAGYVVDGRTLTCLKGITCLSRNTNNVCTACFTGYQLNPLSLQCDTLPPNCRAMNSSTQLCINCTSGFSLNNSICVYSTVNCLTYDIYGYCQTCIQGFTQTQRICLPISPNCQTYNPNDLTTCLVCLPTFRLSNSQCFKSIEGCLVYGSQTICNLCSPSFLLVNGTCFYSDPNCVNQDSSGVCQSCSNGYIPFRSRCVYFDPFCLSYDTTMTCNLTQSSFALNGFTLQQQLSYLNFVMQVQSYSQNNANADFNGGSGQGSYTKNGFLLSAPYAGLSSPSISTYSLNGNVNSCQNNYVLVNAQCVLNPANCLSFNQYGTCQQCNPGYDLMANNTCAFRSSASCSNSAGGICLQAASGFVVIGGSATYAGNNINQVDANGNIVSTKAGYFIWSANNIAWPYDFNCAQQTQPNICQTCSTGPFTLVNNRCIIQRSNCAAYSPYGLCMACNTGFTLWAGECRINNCSRIDSSTGYCLNCNNGLVLQFGICYVRQLNNCQIYNSAGCLYASIGYYLTNTGLSAKMSNFCQMANTQTGRCSQCIYNYTLYQEQCIPQIVNCQVYSASLTTCTTCNTLYFPISSGTVCSYLGYYCAAQANNGQCVTCNIGFTLSVQNGTNICIRPISNCFSYDANIKCIICNSGYVLQYNKCKSLRCSNFSIPSSTCQSCFSPFILMANGTCQDPNCATFSNQICLSCLPRYYLNNGICILSPDLNCLNYSPLGVCLQCAPNYTLNNQGICVSSNVIYYGCSVNQYPCPQCIIGYELNTTNGLCYARRCSAYKQNRDCQSCIYYYAFESSQRFCILYTCASPGCYLNDAPPAGFYASASGNLQIQYCISYSGANCVQCQNYRYPNPSILFNLCYPYNCQSQTILNCSSNCISNFAPTVSSSDSCLATNCLNWDSTGKCLQCASSYQLINSTYCSLVQIPFCLTIDYVNVVCSTCIQGFSLYNEYCRANFCSVWLPNNVSLCQTCIKGYLLTNNNTCSIGKCSQASVDRSQCLQCLLGYILQGSICYANNCLTFDWSTQICVTCQTGYTLIPLVGICKPANCNNLDSNLNCLSCIITSTATYVLRGGICVSVDPNCLTFDSNGNCTACNNPASYIQVQDICVPVISGCNQYNRQGCIACLPAYNLINGLCSVKNCLNYTTPNKCVACQSRYQLQSDSTCYPLNCLSFNNQSWSCASCQPRFQLINNQFCFTFNCSIYTNYICSKCLAGFTLVGQTCAYANCLNNLQFNCPNCVSGFSLIGGVCQAPTTNCLNYDWNNFICIGCSTGYNLTAFGTCILVQIPDPYCYSYNSQTGLCNQCLPNFIFNTISQQCQSSYCNQFNTSQQIRGRICASCVNGFRLDASKRYCISIYCSSYSLSLGSCSSCVGGTGLNNGICYANQCSNYSNLYPLSPVCIACPTEYTLNTNSICQPSFCQIFNSDYTCQTCATNYVLSANNQCISTQCNIGFVFQNFNCVPANCLNYSSTYCNQCLPGFVLERSSCVADSCSNFTNQYKCLQCRTGYNLTIINGEYICVLQIQSVCPNNYYLSNGSCISIPIANCSISDNTGTNCLHCINNYFLLNGICYSITGCSIYSYVTGCFNCLLGYQIQGFLCVSLNCLSIASNNTCLSCIQGYSLVNNSICVASIYQCAQADTQGNCLQCLSNFNLTQGKCIAIGCASYSLTSFICLTCYPNYILNGQICTLKVTLPNCFTVLNATYCSQCNNGFVQLNGICYNQISNCVNYNLATGYCSMCATQFYISSTYNCVPLPANCAQASLTGVCTSCVTGYLAINGQCIANIPNCKAFNPNTALCQLCIQGFYLNGNNQCMSLPQYCLTSDMNGNCLSCASGYSISSSICVRTISYCYIYNQNNPSYCFQCMQGYYLNSVYSCTILPPFCLSANNMGVCLNCSAGYILFNNAICVQQVQYCISYIQNGNTSSQCSQCSQGYTLTNNYQCSALPNNCLSVDANGNCLQCINSYQLYSGFCVFSVQNCYSYNATSYLCSSCFTGYYLYQTNSAYLCKVLPNYCLSADYFGNCLTCLPTYIVYNNLCVLGASILNCQSYNILTYTCINCTQGYYLNSGNICTQLPSNCVSANANGVCASCVANFQLIGANCIRNIAYCSIYNTVLGVCSQCLQGYALSQNYLTCTLAVTNCQSFNSSGGCYLCYNGYYLINGYCIILPQGCAQLNSQQVCVGCISQYSLVQSTCVYSVANCAYYNISGCYQCIPYYYLLNNICYSYPVNCLSFDTSLIRCITCASGYTLNPSTYICSKTIIINYCSAYTANSQCLACNPRYYLLNNVCYAFPQYCVNVDLAGNCLSCAFGSVLQNNMCIGTNSRSLNCLTFDLVNFICQVCMAGYNFCSISGICVLPDPGCSTFASDNSCLQCQPSYQLFQGRCLQYPTGLIITPNGGMSCASGYTQQNNSCFKTQSTLKTFSSMSTAITFSYSSNGINTPPFANSNTFWTPSSSKLNEYISVVVVSGQPQIIFQIGIQGSSTGWVSGYIIQFKNLPSSPFICWNSCNMITGNSDGQNVSLLQLYHPIIATQIRIYPVKWVNQISLRVDFWISTYQ